jgi:hypothetical protein
VSEISKKSERIGEECADKASAVKCDRADYIEGLDDIIARLESCRDAAQEELDNEDDEDEL